VKTIFKNLFGAVASKTEPLCTVKHSITRYRITLEAHWLRLTLRSKRMEGIWQTPAQLRSLAFSSAHKKLATAAASRILSDR
jgi:hypothetical protein